MNRPRCNVSAVNKAIELAGGATQLCLKINVSYQTVVGWKHGRKYPSVVNCQKIEKATNGEVTAKDILPDYPWEDLR